MGNANKKNWLVDYCTAFFSKKVFKKAPFTPINYFRWNSFDFRWCVSFCLGNLGSSYPINRCATRRVYNLSPRLFLFEKRTVSATLNGSLTISNGFYLLSTTRLKTLCNVKALKVSIFGEKWRRMNLEHGFEVYPLWQDGGFLCPSYFHFLEGWNW